MKEITVEVSIAMDRPFYSTEDYYTVEVSDKDYRAIRNVEDWDELPEEVYNRVYKKVLRILDTDLHDDGSLEEGQSPEEFYEISVAYPEWEETVYAAMFEMESWLRPQKYIIEGSSAGEILGKFEAIQDLGCLVRMGRYQEGAAGQKQLEKLEAILDKYYAGELKMKDLKNLKVKLQVGGIVCSAIAEGEEEIAALRAKNPNAR